MSGTKWTPAELKKLRRISDKSPRWINEYSLAGQLAREFGKSPESIRWQLRQMRRVLSPKPVKILLFDIETLPINADIWDVWNQNVNPGQLRKDWSVVCWSAKWLFDKKVHGQVVTQQEAIDRQDKSVMPKIWEMLDEADIVITYNGDNFDFKRLNTRFLVNGFPRPMYYKSIDLYPFMKANFAFTFNKMDYINAVLGIGRKVQTSYHWWKECADGNKKFMDMMLDYNKQDVNILEELYLRVRPWITGHANLNLWSIGKTHVCPNCGNPDLNWNGTYATALGLYAAFRCQHCSAIGRSTKKVFKLKEASVQ